MTFSLEAEMEISVLRRDGSAGDEQNAFSMASPQLFTSAPAEAGRARGWGGGRKSAEVVWQG